jgi:Ca2+-binding EF-hand superfamily protein
MFQNPENLSMSQVETNFWLGALLTVLQGSVFVHYMPNILSDVGLDPAIAAATPALDMPFVAHAVITVGLLALPGLVSLAADKASIPLESMVTSLRSQWEKKTESSERRVVIDLYDRIMQSDKPLKEILSEFDPDGDGMISCWECKQALGHLNLPENQCETLMGLMKRRFGSDIKSLAIESWLDFFQELYYNARQAELGHSEKKHESHLRQLGNELPSKKTFVEIFNDLDKDGDGFISEEDFSAMLDKSNLKTPLTDQEKHELFSNADRLGDGRLNLFEFMSMMRKIVRVGIQEIGYGYLPLAWASLTAYWLGIGMKELGLSLVRLPATFFMDHSMTLPHISASTEIVQALQALLVIGALPISIGLTQKLCDDNKIGGIRFGLHVVIQLALATETLHLMLSSSQLMA